MTDSGTESTASDGGAVRVVLVLGSDHPDAWIRRVIEDCLSSPACRLIAILIAGTIARGALSARPRVSGNFYRRLDDRLFPAKPDAFARADLPSGVHIDQSDVFLTDDHTVLGRQVLSRLEEQQVDVVLALGVPNLEATCPTTMSMWSLDIGGRAHSSWVTGPVPELVAGKHLVVITLRESSTRPRLLGAIRRTVTAVIPWSASLTRNKAMWSSANLIMNALRQVQDRTACSESCNLPLTVSDVGLSTPSRRANRAFTLRQVTRLAAHAMVRTVARDQWGIAYRARNTRMNFGQGGGYRLLKAPPGHSYADPFLIEHSGQHWLFVEDYVYANNRARLVCFELSDNGGQEIVPVLDEPYHLSYPFVFRRQGEVFMIPESGQTGTIELYRSTSFPDRWEPLGPILSRVWASDATVAEYAGLLWLFVTLARSGMHPSDELHLYFATDLMGPWQAHPMNPIVNDVRAGRAAGRPYLMDGTLIRPAQDSASRYGHAINFQAVTLLTVDDYKEATVGRLQADQVGATATHTYNFDARYEVIDLLKSRVRWHS
ncbi:MAG TPA: hypothetical protein VFZ97_06225 [Acidimicrobiales bacterium]